MSREKLTVADLVLLSLLAERPMHGYQANAVLAERKVGDWAGVSRPQIYYSLDKLARLEFIRCAEGKDAAGGPERQVFETTASGREALAAALERDDWTEQSERPAFLTWLALSWQCRPGVFLEQIRKRQSFLRRELDRKRQILLAVRKEVGHRYHEAVWMLTLSIDQIRTELRWLDKVIREAPQRAPARKPNQATAQKGL
jgi:DNA-binding PadR family transcriptional regulator